MIIIRQDIGLNKDLERLLNKYGTTSYALDEPLIEDDIRRLGSRLRDVQCPVSKRNIKGLQRNLRKLLKKSRQSDKLDVKWRLEDGRIVGTPRQMIQSIKYHVRPMDYIKKEDGAIMHLDYSDLLDIMGFEMIHRDIGETRDGLEKKLRDIGIIAVYDGKIMLDILNKKVKPGIRFYDMARAVSVRDTDYMEVSGNKVYTYFGEEQPIGDGLYKSVLDKSADTATALILQNILTKINSTRGGNVLVYGVFTGHLYLAMPGGRNEDLEQMMSESVMIRALGRKFETFPKIQIY